MPLKLTRKHGAQTTITFPSGTLALLQTDGIDHVIVSIDDNLRATQTSAGELIISPACDDWPVCLIEFERFNDWGLPVFAFDAPPEVKIHRDDARVKR